MADKYGVDIDAAWLREVRLATTRIEGGCTGSFVSPDGLILANNRTVAVDPRVMLEALEKVYGATALLQEIAVAK